MDITRAAMLEEETKAAIQIVLVKLYKDYLAKQKNMLWMHGVFSRVNLVGQQDFYGGSDIMKF